MMQLPSSETKHPSKESAPAGESKEIKKHSLPDHALFDHPHLVDMIYHYTNDEFENKDHAFSSVSFTLFENRMPVIILLGHAVRGNYDDVDSILTKNPLLLLEKGTVTDFSGRTHPNRTVYQLALGAKAHNVFSTQGIKVVDGMIEMIEKHFMSLPNKTEEEILSLMQRQYYEQFPDDKDYKETESKKDAKDLAEYETLMDVLKKISEHECKRASDVEDQLHKIIRKEQSPRAEELKNIVQSILKADCEEDFKNFDAAFDALKVYVMKETLRNEAFNFALLKALYRFRNHLEPKRVFTSGKHFNHQLAAKAATDYDANFIAFGNSWNSPKNMFCLQKIFGYIERFLPACDGQVIAQGIYYILEENEKCRLSFAYRFGGGSFLPLYLDPDWEIGYNCAVLVQGGGGERGCWLGWGATFNIYVEQKYQIPPPYTAARNSKSKECLRDNV